MSLADVILDEAESVTFTRHAAGTEAYGICTPGTTSTFSASFAVQPLSSRELQLLPEGERIRGALKLYGSTALIVAAPEVNRLGDRFTYDGLLWEVTAWDKWASADGHYRYRATKVEA